MKIAMVINGFPAGSETFILNQALALHRSGHEIDLYLTNSPPPGLAKTLPEGSAEKALWQCVRGEAESSVRELVRTAFHCLVRSPLSAVRLPVVLLGNRCAVSGRLLRAMLSRPRRYDVIHCHYGINGVRSDLLRRLDLLEGRLVTTFHGYDVAHAIATAGSNRYRNLFARGDLFLPVSEYWKDVLVAVGCPQERTLVHHMGVDCERFRRKDAPEGGKDSVSILSVGRFVEKKGFESAIDAVLELLRRGRRLHYTIIGDGPLRKPLLARVAEARMEGRISMPGWLPSAKVAEGLKTADIFLAPSVGAESGDQEGIPVSIMEAMSAELAVVSTYHSGIPELVEDGVSGLLCRERSHQCLVRSLDLLAGNAALRREMGKQGRRIVETDFNAAIQDARLIALFEKLTENPEGTVPTACHSLGVEP